MTIEVRELRAATKRTALSPAAFKVPNASGGSGVWSAVWLSQNGLARGIQLDWPNVNKIGRSYVGSFGVADRFETVDGDFHTIDFGLAKYDFAIYSHIAHQETPNDNVVVFRKFREALKPGGTLVINDFFLNDDRTFAMMFASQMLVATKAGFTYRQSVYRAWLSEAGFKSVYIAPLAPRHRGRCRRPKGCELISIRVRRCAPGSGRWARGREAGALHGYGPRF
jgi:hypothetical protein